MLQQDQKVIILQELHALEANLINGWDKVYPELFNFLSSMLREIAERLE